jgi:hypothetical protein
MINTRTCKIKFTLHTFQYSAENFQNRTCVRNTMVNFEVFKTGFKLNVLKEGHTEFKKRLLRFVKINDNNNNNSNN